jgi:hypothetical protein
MRDRTARKRLIQVSLPQADLEAATRGLLATKPAKRGKGRTL